MKRQTFLVIAAAAALLLLKVSPGHAQYYGDAPWCAVMEIGDGAVTWDCEFANVEACVPNVLAGNRGFCELNPYFVPTAAPRAYPRRHARHRAYRH